MPKKYDKALDDGQQLMEYEAPQQSQPQSQPQAPEREGEAERLFFRPSCRRSVR